MYIVKMQGVQKKQNVPSFQNLSFRVFLLYSKKPNEDLLTWPIKRALCKVSRKIFWIVLHELHDLCDYYYFYDEFDFDPCEKCIPTSFIAKFSHGVIEIF